MRPPSAFLVAVPLSLLLVALAWPFKRSCSEVDVDALRTFIEERVGKGPDD